MVAILQFTDKKKILNSWDDYVKHGIRIFQLDTMQFPESEVFFVGLVMAFTLTIGSTHLASGPL